MSSFVRSKLEQELLVYGFIREKTDRVNVNIPVALNQQCLLMYDQNISISFPAENIGKFLSMDNHKCIYSKRVIKYKNIEYCCSISPNGWTKQDKGKVIFYLERKSIPSNIKSITFMCKMYCPQTNTRYQCTKKVDTFKSKVLCKWNAKLLSLTQCLNQNELEFICRVDILNLEYNYGQNLVKKGIKLNKYSEITWDVSKLDWANFKYIQGPCCGMWNLALDTTAVFVQYTKYWLKVELNAWPDEVKEIEAECEILLNFNTLPQINKKCKQTYVLRPRFHVLDLSSFNQKFGIPWFHIKEYPLRITVKLNICRIWGLDDVVLDESKWNKYNILM